MSTVIYNKKYFDDEPFNTLFPEPQVDLELVTGRCEAATMYPGALAIFSPSTYANGFIITPDDAMGDDLDAGEGFPFSCMIPPYMEDYPTIPYPKGNSYTYSAGDTAVFAQWKVNMEGWLYCDNDGNGISVTRGDYLVTEADFDGEVKETAEEDEVAWAWIALHTISSKKWVYGRFMGTVKMNAA